MKTLETTQEGNDSMCHNAVGLFRLTVVLVLFFSQYLTPPARALEPQLDAPASEKWATSEGQWNGQFGNNWNVRFDGRPFSCNPSAQYHGAVCRAIAWGKYRAVERYIADTDGNVCTFFGEVDEGIVKGQYHCKNGGPYDWHARVSSLDHNAVSVPLAIAERWSTSEGQWSGQFSNQWDAKFDGSAFSCNPSAQYHGTVCRAIAWGNYRAVERYQASTDGNSCTFFGTVVGGVVSGQYHCNNGGPYAWHAVVR